MCANLSKALSGNFEAKQSKAVCAKLSEALPGNFAKLSEALSRNVESNLPFVCQAVQHFAWKFCQAVEALSRNLDSELSCVC